MPYVDTLLTSGEVIQYRTKKHWIAPVLAAVPGALILLGGIISLIVAIIARNVAVIDKVTLWGGLAATIIGGFILGVSFAHWFTQEYVVTNHKVIKAEGWLRKKSEGASLEKINEIEMEQSFIGRLMHFGTLNVRTASDEADLRYWMMREPEDFRKHMLEAKMELERSDANFIAEAVHSAAAPAAAPAAVTTPMPAVEPTADPAQIPAMIQQLAALRDAGAITTEEFEAKKTDLLGRM